MKIRMILVSPFSGEGEDEEVKSAAPNNFFGRKSDLCKQIQSTEYFKYRRLQKIFTA